MGPRHMSWLWPTRCFAFPDVTNSCFYVFFYPVWFWQPSPALSTLRLRPLRIFLTLSYSQQPIDFLLSYGMSLTILLIIPSRLLLLFFLVRLIVCTYFSQAKCLVLSLLPLILLTFVTPILPSLQHAPHICQVPYWNRCFATLWPLSQNIASHSFISTQLQAHVVHPYSSLFSFFSPTVYNLANCPRHSSLSNSY